MRSAKLEPDTEREWIENEKMAEVLNKDKGNPSQGRAKDQLLYNSC